MQHITAPELADWLADSSRPQPLLLDVRQPWEFDTCHLNGAVSMPMNSVPANVDQFDREQPIVCICHHGMRSMQVAAFLEQQGFDGIVNLTGGVDAWATLVDTAMPKY